MFKGVAFGFLSPSTPRSEPGIAEENKRQSGLIRPGSDESGVATSRIETYAHLTLDVFVFEPYNRLGSKDSRF